MSVRGHQDQVQVCDRQVQVQVRVQVQVQVCGRQAQVQVRVQVLVQVCGLSGSGSGLWAPGSHAHTHTHTHSLTHKYTRCLMWNEINYHSSGSDQGV